MTNKAAISALKAGDEQAFNFLFEQYADKLLRFFYTYVKQRDIAKEFTQDVFLKVWVNRQNIEVNDYFEAWLFKLAKNHLFDYLRRKVKERHVMKEIHAVTPDTTSPSDTPQELFLLKEATQQYHTLLNELDTDQKKIYLLNREKGLTYQQIATQLNISVKSVEWNITKTRKFLQHRLRHFFTLLLFLLTQR
jgi:RNA polymerase sigma-70 factor (ECF subfamily)